MSLVMINPLFLRLLWKETPHLLLAHYSGDVFKEIKRLLEEDFITAVRSYRPIKVTTEAL